MSKSIIRTIIFAVVVSFMIGPVALVAIEQPFEQNFQRRFGINKILSMNDNEVSIQIPKDQVVLIIDEHTSLWTWTGGQFALTDLEAGRWIAFVVQGKENEYL